MNEVGENVDAHKSPLIGLKRYVIYLISIKHLRLRKHAINLEMLTLYEVSLVSAPTRASISTFAENGLAKALKNYSVIANQSEKANSHMLQPLDAKENMNFKIEAPKAVQRKSRL